MKKKVLVIAGPLANYHYRLFGKVRQLVNTEWLFLVSMQKSQGEFVHENFLPEGFEYLDVNNIGLLSSVCSVIKYKPDVFFFYGNNHKLLLGLASIIGNIRNTKMYYASDDNISQIKPLLNRLGKAALLSFLSLMHVKFLSLGYTNRLFFRRNFVEKINGIPCYAVNFDEWNGQDICDNKETEKRIQFLTIARFIEVKNIKRLIQAFQCLSKEFDNICLNIIGDGPCFQKLKQLIDPVPTAGINLLGSVARHEIGGYIFSHDAMVLPSIEEPWGIVVVESLGCGKPVVATQEVGSALSLSGILGGVVLSENTSVEGLYAALKAYLDNKAQYDQLAKNQKEWVIRKYGASFVAKKYALLIDEKFRP